MAFLDTHIHHILTLFCFNCLYINSTEIISPFSVPLQTKQVEKIKRNSMLIKLISKQTHNTKNQKTLLDHSSTKLITKINEKKRENVASVVLRAKTKNKFLADEGKKTEIKNISNAENRLFDLLFDQKVGEHSGSLSDQKISKIDFYVKLKSTYFLCFFISFWDISQFLLRRVFFCLFFLLFLVKSLSYLYMFLFVSSDYYYLFHFLILCTTTLTLY